MSAGRGQRRGIALGEDHNTRMQSTTCSSTCSAEGSPSARITTSKALTSPTAPSSSAEGSPSARITTVGADQHQVVTIAAPRDRPRRGSQRRCARRGSGPCPRQRRGIALGEDHNNQRTSSSREADTQRRGIALGEDHNGGWRVGLCCRGGRQRRGIALGEDHNGGAVGADQHQVVAAPRDRPRRGSQQPDAGAGPPRPPAAPRDRPRRGSQREDARTGLDLPRGQRRGSQLSHDKAPYRDPEAAPGARARRGSQGCGVQSATASQRAVRGSRLATRFSILRRPR